jgi:hypothetical protein
MIIICEISLWSVNPQILNKIDFGSFLIGVSFVLLLIGIFSKRES